jgi:hypothetical protein
MAGLGRNIGRFAPARTSAAVVVSIALVVAGCGSTRTVTDTSTTTQTTTETDTVTVTKHGPPPPAKTVTTTLTTTATPASSSGSSSAGGLSWSGNGGEHIGTINVPQDSEIQWTNDGSIFQVFDNENGPEVNSQASSGQSAISAGTYHGFEVNAVGNWTIKIVPQ